MVIDGVEIAITAAQLESLKKAALAKTTKALAAGLEYETKYPFVVPGTIKTGIPHGEAGLTASTVTVKCPACGISHERFTSDLHTYTVCKTCLPARKKEAAKVKAALLKRAMELVKEGKI